MFGTFNFDNMTETDVRENIIAPLLAELGYRHSSPFHIVTEKTFRVSRASFGRPKPGDPLIFGRPDYILQVEGRRSWVLEAKAPNEITSADRIQAYTYARHPEVRAVYFVVCNGRTLEIHRTEGGPDAGPVMVVAYEDLRDQLPRIKRVLSPESIIRTFPEADYGEPIGPGLGSSVRVLSGSIWYERFAPAQPNLVGMQHQIVEGSLERDGQGSLLAYLKIRAGRKQLSDLLEQLELDTYDLRADAHVLSGDEKAPTVFTSDRAVVYPRGSQIPNLFTGEVGPPLPCDLTIRIESTASVWVSGGLVKGDFVALFHFPDGRKVTGHAKAEMTVA